VWIIAAWTSLFCILVQLGIVDLQVRHSRTTTSLIDVVVAQEGEQKPIHIKPIIHKTGSHREASADPASIKE
jgi:hypothetical protein